MRRSIWLALALLVLGGARLQAQGYVVIVNTANPASSLSKAQVAEMFLKKTGKWADGKSVAVVDQSRASGVREAFSKSVLGRPVNAVNAYWQQQIFSGKDVPPPEKEGDAEVVAFVKSNPGAIGYVSAGAELSGVKKVGVE